jgi:hypothetical protein
MVRVNVLCTVGAVTGVIAVFSTWISVLYLDYNLLSIIRDMSPERLGYWSAIVVVIGVLVSFITPLGSLAEILGVAMWWIYVFDIQGVFPAKPGSYIAMASAIILIVSMLRPYGPGLMTGPFRLRDRLLTFSARTASSSPEPRKVYEPDGADKYCRHCGGPIAEAATMCHNCGRPPT